MKHLNNYYVMSFLIMYSRDNELEVNFVKTKLFLTLIISFGRQITPKTRLLSGLVRRQLESRVCVVFYLLRGFSSTIPFQPFSFLFSLSPKMTNTFICYGFFT